MKTRTFTVDAKLLQELGERLVGRRYIALSELIKNAFDADARHVEIFFDGRSIRVDDDGHGMDELAFTSRWMRIGTPQKGRDRVSPLLSRPLTGSKGVGRLAAQLLATRLDLRSSAIPEPARKWESQTLAPSVHASIDWPAAMKKENLTEVTVNFETSEPGQSYANGSRHGTSILLEGLVGEWAKPEFELLAREIWALQPPFAEPSDSANAFSITLRTPFEDVQTIFDRQMSALLRNASAVVKGRLLKPATRPSQNLKRILLPSAVEELDESGSAAGLEQPPETQSRVADTRLLLVTVDLKGAEKEQYVIEITDCHLVQFDFEFRVFDLVGRQPDGIQVSAARDYLATFGGMHIYDNGFRLPYYGADSDWLKLELDHARRLSRSQLLPPELQVADGMQDLPSNKRVFGAVNVSTSREAEAAVAQQRRASEALSIQITRDRLVDSKAFAQLTRSVRLSVDLYASVRARTKARQALERPRLPRLSKVKLDEAHDALEAVRADLSPQTYETVRGAISSAEKEVTQSRNEARAYASLLGSLATAGMTSLAFEHEVSRQRGQISEIARKLQSLRKQLQSPQAAVVADVVDQLEGWGERTERLRNLFRPLLDQEDRTQISALSARKVIQDVVKDLHVLARGCQVDVTQVDAETQLPPGTFTAWSAIFQNILVNAFKATLGVDSPTVRVRTIGGGRAGLIFEDNGVGGVDVMRSEHLFSAFEQGRVPSEKERALGMEGSGLGLTIVRMITDELRCRISFRKPDPEWSTALEITWEAKNHE